MPWIVLTTISLTLDIFHVFEAVINLDPANAIGGILAWILGAYFLCVVWSLKTEIEDEDLVSLERHRHRVGPVPVHFKRDEVEIEMMLP